MTKKPKLHIPQPTARPGEAPDFSYLELSEAGSVERPPIDAKASAIEHLALNLVRVLDDDHVARGPWDPKLDKETLIEALRLMVLTRAYDDRITRLRLKQAYGRLVRRADDRGVFVLLDPMMPSRLAGAFPPGVEVQRTGLAEAVKEVAAFLAP